VAIDEALIVSRRRDETYIQSYDPAEREGVSPRAFRTDQEAHALTICASSSGLKTDRGFIKEGTLALFAAADADASSRRFFAAAAADEDGGRLLR
jgi:hypothetical protein